MKRLYTYPEFYVKAFSRMTDDAPAIRSFAERCPDGDILEIGGGSGRTIGFFDSKRHVLLESDPEMLGILREKVAQFPNIRVIHGKCPAIPATSASFSGVFAAFGTIGEINPICVTLQEIERVLVPGGYALLSALNPDRYMSPPMGIQRTKAWCLKDFSVISNTLPIPSLGVGEYQTHIWLRQAGLDQHFTVRQYFPNLDQWKLMIQQAGLELAVDEAQLQDAQVFSFLLRKPQSEFLSAQNPIATVYDSIGSHYDKFISKAEYGVPHWIGPHLERMKGLHPRVIDLACGNGYVGCLISEKQIQCSELLGYDISSAMVNECRKNGQYTKVCHFDLAFGLPGVGALTTDFVTAFGLMEFLTDDITVLRDIRRVLVLGGELLCTFEATEADRDEDQVEMLVNGQTVFRHRRSKKSVERTLIEAGFSNITIERHKGYRSPTTGVSVDYLYVRALREGL